MVLDTSALLAIVFDEPTAEWCLRLLEPERNRILMSTVNLTEALIQIDDKKPKQGDLIREHIAALPIEWIPPTTIQAELAAAARLKFSLNLGDCFAYSLAKLRDDSLLTLDRDFKNTGIAVILPPRRSGSSPTSPTV